MLDALAEHFPREARWTHPQGGLFIWVTLPDYIDTTDLLARALREHVAFVPGAGRVRRRPRRQLDAAELLGVDEDADPRGDPPDRRDRARAGRAVRHAHRRQPAQPPADRRRGAAARRAEPTRRTLRLTRSARSRGCTRREELAGASASRRADDVASRFSRAGARSSARCRSRSGARVEDALERLGHEVVAIDVGADLVARLTAHRARRRVRRAARPRRRGRDRAGAARGARDPLHGLGRVGLHPRRRTRSWPSTRCATRGIPTPDFFAFNETALRRARRRPRRCRRSRSGSSSRSSSSPPRQGSALGIKFARSAADVPAALVAAFSYDRKVLLERYVAGRELAVSMLERGRRPAALPIVEAVPEQEDFYDFEARYEIGRTRFVCPAELDAGGRRARPRDRARGVRAARLLRLRARRPDARRPTTGELYVLEVNAIPGLTETSLLPQAADAAGIGFDELVGRTVGSR